MLFARVEADLDRHSPRKSPRKAVSKDTGFESPIPHKGIRRARKVVVAGKISRLLPDALGFRDLLFVKECGDEVIGVGVERQLGMKGCKPIPDADGICRMAFANLVENCRGIGIARRRKHAIHNEVDIRLGAQGARKSLSSTLRFRLYGAAHLEKSSVQFALPEKKIGIAPGDFGGQGISAFRMKKCVARGRNISFGFVDSCQVRPKIRRTRVERQSCIVRLESSRRVRLFEVVLPIAAEQEPVLEVARLEACGMLIPLTSLQSD